MRNHIEDGISSCPACGEKGILTVPGGINEYDPRQETLGHHKNPNGEVCTNLTTRDDAKRFLRGLGRWGKFKRGEIPSLFPAMREEVALKRK